MMNWRLKQSITPFNIYFAIVAIISVIGSFFITKELNKIVIAYAENNMTKAAEDIAKHMETLQNSEKLIREFEDRDKDFYAMAEKIEDIREYNDFKSIHVFVEHEDDGVFYFANSSYFITRDYFATTPNAVLSARHPPTLVKNVYIAKDIKAPVETGIYYENKDSHMHYIYPIIKDDIVQSYVVIGWNSIICNKIILNGILSILVPILISIVTGVVIYRIFKKKIIRFGKY